MPCLFVIVSFFVPRAMMFFIFLLTDWFNQAYETALWPILGFLFMPYTTLAYMAAMHYNHHDLSGGWIVLMIAAVVTDLGGQGGSAKARARSKKSRSAETN